MRSFESPKDARSTFNPDIAETTTALSASPRFACGCFSVVQTQERRTRPDRVSGVFNIAPAAAGFALRRRTAFAFAKTNDRSIPSATGGSEKRSLHPSLL